jgi:hypothetical protein
MRFRCSLFLVGCLHLEVHSDLCAVAITCFAVPNLYLSHQMASVIERKLLNNFQSNQLLHSFSALAKCASTLVISSSEFYSERCLWYTQHGQNNFDIFQFPAKEQCRRFVLQRRNLTRGPGVGMFQSGILGD